MPGSVFNEIDSMGPIDIAVYSSSMLRLWVEQSLPGMDCAKAYTLLKFGKCKAHPYYTYLLKAMLRLHKQEKNSKATPYLMLSEHKRSYALWALNNALEQFPMRDHQWLALIPKFDHWRTTILARYEDQFTFRRDPADSVDLEALAHDRQSVHRASVQTALRKGLTLLYSYPVPDHLDSFNEIMDEARTRGLFRPKHSVMYTFACDCDVLQVALEDQTVQYMKVVDHLWAHIRTHKHRDELVKRLFEELEEGSLHCGNGKVARLINVLSGFEEIDVCLMDAQELFQNKIVELIPLSVEERTSRVRQLFSEFKIEEADQGPWLEALENC
jgi:hypothetical protein